MSENLYPSSNEITKESLFTALMILMETKAFDEISITELCTKAGVSRMAYYRNYQIKEDLLIEHMDQILIHATNTFAKCEQQDLKTFVSLHFSVFRNESVFINCLIQSKLTDLLFERLTQTANRLFDYLINEQTGVLWANEELIAHLFINCPREFITNPYVSQFVIGGFYRILINWVTHGMKESEEEMVNMLLRTVTIFNYVH